MTELYAIQWQDVAVPWGWETAALFETKELADAAWTSVKALSMTATRYRYGTIRTMEDALRRGSRRSDDVFGIEVLEAHPE